jgi:hypothetical protein
MKMTIWILDSHFEYAENENWVYDVEKWLQTIFESSSEESFQAVRRRILQLSHVRNSLITSNLCPYKIPSIRIMELVGLKSIGWDEK